MDVKESLAEYMKVLDEFAAKTHVNRFKASDVIETVLESDELMRASWSEIELLNKRFELHRYSGFLQRAINQNEIKRKWATHNLSVMYGKIAKGYGDTYTSYQERKDMSVADNEVVKVLCEILLAAETRIAQLHDLSRHISDMARALEEMAKTKRAERYESRT